MTRRRSVFLTAVAGAVCLLASCASGTKTAAKSKPLEPTTSSTSTTSSSTTTTGPTTTTLSSPASVPGGSTTVAPPRVVTTMTTIAPVNPTGIVRAPVDGAIQITAADHNSVFAVALGEKVELTLSSAGMQFNGVQAMPAGLLQLDGAPPPPVYGQRVLWTAVERGTVTVTSGESAVCGPPVDDVCPMFVLLWTVKLVIS